MSEEKKQKRGRRRSISHEAVLIYAQANPRVYQSDIATYFGTSQSRVSQILRTGGITGIQRGRTPKRKDGMDDETHKWEQILHECGLGMERGARLNNRRVLYGYDPNLERSDDESATSNSGF